jgi:hypothetical protein
LKLQPDWQSCFEHPAGQLSRLDLAKGRTEQDREALEKAPGLYDLDRPIEVGAIADDNLKFVRRFEPVEIAPDVGFSLAGAWRFEIKNHANASIDGGNVDRTAGFKQNGLAGIGEPSHERVDFRLQEWLAAGDLDQVVAQRERLRDNTIELDDLSFGKRVRRVAVDAP